METEPAICVSLGDIPFDTILEILPRVEMAEIRLDLASPDKSQSKIIFSGHKNLIATCREGKHDDNARAAMLKEAMENGAAWVDIEADATPEWRDMMIKSVKGAGRGLILSRHFYTGTPSAGDLRGYIDEMFGLGADIAKMACQVNILPDAATLLGLYGEYKNIVAIGMGPLGVITRVAAPLLGAPFTFAFFGESPATAAGQVEYHELSGLIKKISSYG
jgi:3-dehydroquinate dehydratase I